jgi:hypothetical protein
MEAVVHDTTRPDIHKSRIVGWKGARVAETEDKGVDVKVV